MAQTGTETEQKETGTALTATVVPSRPGWAHIAPDAGFVSQLIAERDRLAPQRLRRRVPPGVAVDAYAAGTRIADRRMPIGYRKTLVA